MHKYKLPYDDYLHWQYVKKKKRPGFTLMLLDHTKPLAVLMEMWGTVHFKHVPLQSPVTCSNPTTSHLFTFCFVSLFQSLCKWDVSDLWLDLLAGTLPYCHDVKQLQTCEGLSGLVGMVTVTLWEHHTEMKVKGWETGSETCPFSSLGTKQCTLVLSVPPSETTVHNRFRATSTSWHSTAESAMSIWAA